MGVVASFAIEGSKQALSLGLMAQKKLQDAQSFDSNEAYSSFSKDQQAQLLKGPLTIELAGNAFRNLASDGKASPSASASLTRLEQRLRMGPVPCVVIAEYNGCRSGGQD